MRRILYLGLELPDHLKESAIHFPMIRIEPKEKEIRKALANWDSYSHLLLTSKTAVSLLLERQPRLDLNGKEILAIGKATAERIEQYGGRVSKVAKQETQEGMLKFFEQGHYFWPHSALSRPVIRNYCKEKGILLTEAIFYETKVNWEGTLPELFEEIFFTSPSTVSAFIERFGALPKDKVLTPIGEVTRAVLVRMSQDSVK